MEIQSVLFSLNICVRVKYPIKLFLHLLVIYVAWLYLKMETINGEVLNLAITDQLAILILLFAISLPFLFHCAVIWDWFFIINVIYNLCDNIEILCQWPWVLEFYLLLLLIRHYGIMNVISIPWKHAWNCLYLQFNHGLHKYKVRVNQN